MAKAKWGVNTYVKVSKKKIGRHKKNLNKSERIVGNQQENTYFSYKSICQLLEESGFSVERIEYSWEAHTLSYIFHVLHDYYDNWFFRMLNTVSKNKF